MDILIFLAFACITIGIFGAVLPILPGLPICYLGLLCLHWSNKVEFGTNFLIFWAIIVLLVTLLDYFTPIWGTKRFGGSQRGVWGCSIGMVVGMFFSPLGIILAPFLGAVIGELTLGYDFKKALKAGFGAFLGFFTGIIAKLIVGGFILYYAIQSIL